MATYAIGDIQGCFDTLKALLHTIEFDRRRDRLWLAGDLVNRGPRSLDVLRWAVELDDRVTAVLGNHDLSLLATAGGKRKQKRRDTLSDVLKAQDRDDLLLWLRTRPLFAVDGEWAMVHAGLLPRWSTEVAERIAREIEPAIADESWLRVWKQLVDEKEPHWLDDSTGDERVAAALAVFTSMRTIRTDGRLCKEFTGPPAEAPRGCVPWYEQWNHAGEPRIVFGHWAALGYHRTGNAVCIDSGCVWGDCLTALRLDDDAVFHEPAIDRRPDWLRSW